MKRDCTKWWIPKKVLMHGIIRLDYKDGTCIINVFISGTSETANSY
jgi:hypothetical protein